MDKYVRRAFRTSTSPSSLSFSSADNSIIDQQQQQQRHPLSCALSQTSLNSAASQSAVNDLYPPVASDYQADHKEGYLWKRGKKRQSFYRRLFILDGDENTLRYYNQESVTVEPKATFRIDDQLNVVVLPEKIGHPNAMQITCDIDDNRRRNLFVYAASGKDLVEWLSCIRWLKFKHLSVTYRNNLPDSISNMLTHDFVREGWMHKTGPRSSDLFRKRWFTLDGVRLFYAKGPLEAWPQSIELGARRAGYSILDDQPQGYRHPPRSCSPAFTLVTPSRKYVLAAESAAEREQWMYWLRFVIEKASGHGCRS